MNTYEPVIGLEVHVELNTKSKMFCSCSADYFGKEPNTHTCPVCLGLPGALPYVNEEAIQKCIQIGLALNCQVAEKSLFERKNYFYPDLPKGYQISQYRWPLCINGRLTLNDGETIRINRVHQEEDTAKLTHQLKTQNSKLKDQNFSLIDFNRSGVPLVEIVTEPDFTSSSQVRDYAKKLQQIFRYLGVSNADMEKGDMRLEANVSVRPSTVVGLPNYRVELKNINSFRFMVAAVEYEIDRQVKVLDQGDQLVQETRGWDEAKKQTYIQRSKEEAHDYRYFSEPDLPELRISKVKNLLPELPGDKVRRFEREYGLREDQARILAQSRPLADFFEQAVADGKKQAIKPEVIANIMINKKVDWNALLPAKLIQALVKAKKPVLSKEVVRTVVGKVVEDNPQLVSDYKSGKIQVVGFLIGQVRRQLPEADPRSVKSMLEKELS